MTVPRPAVAVLCAWTPHENSGPGLPLAAATQTTCAARAPPGGSRPPPPGARERAPLPPPNGSSAGHSSTGLPHGLLVQPTSPSRHAIRALSMSRPFLKLICRPSLRHLQLRDLRAHRPAHLTREKTRPARRAAHSRGFARVTVSGHRSRRLSHRTQHRAGFRSLPHLLVPGLVHSTAATRRMTKITDSV